MEAGKKIDLDTDFVDGPFRSSLEGGGATFVFPAESKPHGRQAAIRRNIGMNGWEFCEAYADGGKGAMWEPVPAPVEHRDIPEIVRAVQAIAWDRRRTRP